MLHKSCPAKVKAIGEADGLDEGTFEAVVSVFGNRDVYGDVVMPGAFADDLKAWEDSGDPIPVYWSHRLDDPDFNIGHVLEAKETDQGLWVKAQMDLDGAKAQTVYRLLKGRRVTQFSFAYDVLDGALRDGDEDVYELRKLKVYEVGPTPIGANDQTELLGVKAAGEHVRHFTAAVKAGRVLSAKNENTLREAKTALDAAAQQITDVLSSVEEQANDQGKASGTGPATTQEPSGATVQEPSRSPSAKSLAAQMALLAPAQRGEGGSP